MHRSLFSLSIFYIGCNAELEKSTEELQVENNNLQADVAELTNMVIELQTEIEVLKNEQMEQNLRLDTVENNVTENGTEINTLEDTTLTLQSEIDAINTALGDYPTNEDMTVYVAENAPTIELFSDLEMRTFGIETTIGEHSTDIQTLQASMSTVEGNVQTLTGNYTNLEMTVLTLNSTTSTIQGEIQTLSSTINTLESDLQSNSTDLNILQTTVESHSETLENNTLLLEDLDGAVLTLESNGAQTIIETGTVLIWSGTLNNIPAGWALCDGTNGTPNLTNRFVVGAGDSYAVDSTGGSTSNTVSSTSRAVNPCSDNWPNFFCSNSSAQMVKTVSGGSSLPPYYAMAYIMKL